MKEKMERIERMEKARAIDDDSLKDVKGGQNCKEDTGICPVCKHYFSQGLISHVRICNG